jgi:hypothetical protein
MINEGFITANSSPRFNLATNPWYANIMILPKHIKQGLMEKYKQHQAKYLDNQDIQNGFNMILYNLSVGDENKGGILEFKKFNDELDEYRNETLEDIIPELKEVYAWAAS